MTSPTSLRHSPHAAHRAVAFLLAISAGAFVSAPAVAAGGLILIDAPPESGYTFLAGPNLLAYTPESGSSKLKTLVIPGIDFYSSWGGFASTDIGLGWNFSHRKDLQFGLRLWPQVGRDDDDPHLRGLDDIGTRLGKGLFANYAPWEFLTLQSSLLYGSGRSGDGLKAEAGATVGARLGASAVLGVSLGATWANRAHREGYYGITARESVASGLPEWSVGAGWQDVNLAVSGVWTLNDRWSLSGQVLTAHLLGDAARSPVTESRNPTNVSLTLWYRFK